MPATNQIPRSKCIKIKHFAFMCTICTRGQICTRVQINLHHLKRWSKFAPGCKFLKHRSHGQKYTRGANLHPGCKFAPGANCAHERGLSCITTAYTVQEVIQYNIDRGSCTYAAFVDIKRAFDTVWHSSLFVKLHRLGIRGKVWRILLDMYNSLESCVSLNRKLSGWFPVEQGVRQWSVLSTFLYIVFMNELLEEIQNSRKGSCIGTTDTSCPAYVDDTVFLANSPNRLQDIVNTAFVYACKNHFEIHPEKTFVSIFGKRLRTINQNIHIKLGNRELPQKHLAVHLGILQESSRCLNNTVKEACIKGRNAFFSLANTGVRPCGLNPKVSVSLYKKVVIPTITYGCELWSNLTMDNCTEINKIQRFIVKKIQGFNPYVRSDMCESMLGLYNLMAEVNRRKLLFLGKLCTLPSSSVPNQLFYLRLFLFFDGYKDSGFMSDIWAILGKYGLSQYVRDFVNKLEFPSLRQWKQIVNKTVFQTEEQLWLHRVNNDPDFMRFCQLHDNIHIAPIYNTPLSKVLRNKNLMISIARMWVAKPPLTRQCSSCNIQTKDILLHTVTDCPYLRFYTNYFLYIILQVNYDLACELSTCQRQEFLFKLLGLKFDTPLSEECYSVVEKSCFKFLEAITMGLRIY